MKRYEIIIYILFCILVMMAIFMSIYSPTSVDAKVMSEPPASIIQSEVDLHANATINVYFPLYFEPVLSSEPADVTETIPPRYGFSEEEIYLLAQLVCGDGSIDGDGEYDIDFQTTINYHEFSKVLGVVMNRIRDSRFPNTISKVVLSKNQFSVFPKNKTAIPSQKALNEVRAWCDAYDNHSKSIQVIPENHIYFYGDGYVNHSRP